MTQEEFDIIDALYFMTSYEQLAKDISIKKSELDENLQELIKKGWINAFEHPDALPLQPEELKIEIFEKLYFLASKKGLLEHNSR